MKKRKLIHIYAMAICNLGKIVSKEFPVHEVPMYVE